MSPLNCGIFIRSRCKSLRLLSCLYCSIFPTCRFISAINFWRLLSHSISSSISNSLKVVTYFECAFLQDWNKFFISLCASLITLYIGVSWQLSSFISCPKSATCLRMAPSSTFRFRSAPFFPFNDWSTLAMVGWVVVFRMYSVCTRSASSNSSSTLQIHSSSWLQIASRSLSSVSQQKAVFLLARFFIFHF